MKKLAIICTHPIQYNAPVFRLLTERRKIAVKVFYTWEQSRQGVFDKKFNQHIQWDIPLLEGYDYQFVKNVSNDQGTHHFKGMVNPLLNQEIEKWEPNAVLVFGWNFHSHFRAMRYFKGRVPVYFRGDSTLLDENKGFKTFLRRIWLRFVYRFVDLAFYVGENNKSYFLKHGIAGKKLVFAPHAIDNDRFIDSGTQYATKAEVWKKELGIESDEMVFLYAGKFEEKKNPMLFIQAAHHFKGKNCKFILAGDGILKEKLREMAAGNPDIIFLPFQNQSLMPILYRLCNVFVLPSKGPGETWGLAVNEAMACGRAVLVSDKVGSALNLVKEEVNGYVFKSNDLQDFTKRIQQFDFDKIKLFSENSPEIIKKYSFTAICEAIEKTLTEYGG